MQPIVLDRRRWRHRVSPRAAEPLDPAPVLRITRHPLQGIQNVVQAHLPHPVQQGAGVLQHHARFFTFVDELRDELAHAFIAPDEHRRVVVVADPLVVHHVLQVADDVGGAKIGAAGWNQWLVHVQRDRARRLDAAESDLVLRPNFVDAAARIAFSRSASRPAIIGNRSMYSGIAMVMGKRIPCGAFL